MAKHAFALFLAILLPLNGWAALPPGSTKGMHPGIFPTKKALSAMSPSTRKAYVLAVLKAMADFEQEMNRAEEVRRRDALKAKKIPTTSAVPRRVPWTTSVLLQFHPLPSAHAAVDPLIQARGICYYAGWVSTFVEDRNAQPARRYCMPVWDTEKVDFGGNTALKQRVEQQRAGHEQARAAIVPEAPANAIVCRPELFGRKEGQPLSFPGNRYPARNATFGCFVEFQKEGNEAYVNSVVDALTQEVQQDQVGEDSVLGVFQEASRDILDICVCSTQLEEARMVDPIYRSHVQSSPSCHGLLASLRHVARNAEARTPSLGACMVPGTTDRQFSHVVADFGFLDEYTEQSIPLATLETEVLDRDLAQPANAAQWCGESEAGLKPCVISGGAADLKVQRHEGDSLVDVPNAVLMSFGQPLGDEALTPGPYPRTVQVDVAPSHEGEHKYLACTQRVVVPAAPAPVSTPEDLPQSPAATPPPVTSPGTPPTTPPASAPTDADPTVLRASTPSLSTDTPSSGTAGRTPSPAATRSAGQAAGAAVAAGSTGVGVFVGSGVAAGAAAGLSRPASSPQAPTSCTLTGREQTPTHVVFEVHADGKPVVANVSASPPPASFDGEAWTYPKGRVGTEALRVGIQYRGVDCGFVTVPPMIVSPPSGQVEEDVEEEKDHGEGGPFGGQVEI